PYNTEPDARPPSAAVYCPGNEATFEFLQNVLTEVMALFPGQYIHIGGDEVNQENWRRCPKCQARMRAEGLNNEHELQSYFIRRIETFLNSRGRTLIGWSEICEGGLPQRAAVMDWLGSATKAASLGHDVVMTPTNFCYLDYWQSTNHAAEPPAFGGDSPLAQVYSFEPVPQDLGAPHVACILGTQGNLWTEYVPSLNHAEYMMFPRLCALSEVAWSPRGSRNYDDFIRRLQPHLQRFDQLGVSYCTNGLSTSADLELTVDASQVTGSINGGLLGVNHGPLAVYQPGALYNGSNAVDLSAWYSEAGIPSVRLDEFGYIDFQAFFPNFAADPDKPENYRFAVADRYLQSILDVGADVFFRLGYSERPQRVDPPSDNEKWTQVMLHVIRHYRQGWANGHHWNIRYWEVWNEPSGEGWTGTPQEYFRLYATVAKEVKNLDPSLMVGGPALGSPDPNKDRAFAAAFIEYCQQHQLPLDFFSWHHYFIKPQEFIEHAARHRRDLDGHGFKNTKLFLTEWGWYSGRPTHLTDRATIDDAAADLSAMMVLQDRVELAHFYVGDAMAGHPWGLFDFIRNGSPVSARPRKSYYAFKAYHELTQTPLRLRCQGNQEVDRGGCGFLAGLTDDHRRIAVLLSNFGTQTGHYSIKVIHVPWTGSTRLATFLLDRRHDLECTDRRDVQPDGGIAVNGNVEVPSAWLISLSPATASSE
ncbi:MAG TPA: family 20 glycosylhydrolase, partial [Candidatus Acidoferrum sp.]|nr:family 20 glycosylhydrolase [Candidatus Acidoferrum sp.]